LGVSSFASFFLSSELGGTSGSLEGLVALTEDGSVEGFVALEGLVALTEDGRPPSDGEADNWKAELNSGTGRTTGTLLD
jgi:hypothetical protein